MDGTNQSKTEGTYRPALGTKAKGSGSAFGALRTGRAPMIILWAILIARAMAQVTWCTGTSPQYCKQTKISFSGLQMSVSCVKCDLVGTLGSAATTQTFLWQPDSQWLGPGTSPSFTLPQVKGLTVTKYIMVSSGNTGTLPSSTSVTAAASPSPQISTNLALTSASEEEPEELGTEPLHIWAYSTLLIVALSQAWCLSQLLTTKIMISRS